MIWYKTTFLQLDMSLEDWDYPGYIDKPKTTLATLLSNIAGRLNFSTVIRLCYKNEKTRKKARKKQNQSDLDKLWIRQN